MYCHHSNGDDNVDNVNIITADVDNASASCDDCTGTDDADVYAWSDDAVVN